MKKRFFTLALILGLVTTVTAQEKGLFGYGPQRGGDYSTEYRSGESGLLNLPTTHGDNNDQPAPLGTGTALLLGLGAAYLVTKKNRKE